MQNENDLVLERTKASIGSEKYKMTVESAGHTIIADEPASNKGGDRGMNPFSLLISGLASCSVVTVKMFADRRGWALHNAEVFVTMKRVKNEDGTNKTEMVKELVLDGNLSEEQREKLLDVAAHCAVHKILTGEIDIKTTMRPETVSSH